MPTSHRNAPRVEPVPAALAGLSPAECLARLRRRRGLVFLDSAGGSPQNFSLLAFDPLRIPAPQDLRGLRETMRSLERVGGDRPPFFSGGFLGALSYDLGVEHEALALPRDPWRLPRVLGGLYVDFLLFDHGRGETWLVLGERPSDDRPSLAQRRDSLHSDLALEPAPRAPFRVLSGPRRLVSSRDHRRRVERAREEIGRGEIYQANLSHRFAAEVEGDPLDIYLALRRAHPAPYAGFLAQDDAAILCASPELLLELEAGVARTRPIKGTAPRGVTSEEDERNAAALLASDKDRAELAMIVDLERNDLGRVAVAGGVTVDPFPRLESYVSVHHLVADVRARLPAERDPIDVLASLFPGGSVTGAPKLRSMELIGELEEEGRGFSYGSLVALDTEGRLAANILIRTLLWRARPGPESSGAGEVTWRLGGGITWGSDPAAEEAESLAKGSALAEVLRSREARVARA